MWFMGGYWFMVLLPYIFKKFLVWLAQSELQAGGLEVRFENFLDGGDISFGVVHVVVL
jgi:hypothetical protein